MTLGICRAPPPLVTHLPVTVPPARNSGRNRPSRTQSWSQGPAVGDPDAVQLLVLDQRLHGRMVEGLDLPPPGRLHLDAGLRERLDDVSGQIGPHPAPEGLGHLVGQLGETPGLAAAGIPLTEQFVQHPAVGLGAPRQPGAVHLGGHQHPRRLGGGQQVHPVGVVGGVVPSLLVGVDLDEVGQRQMDALRLEQGRLGARFGRALGRVGRYGAAAQPGQGGRGRAGLAVSPRVAEQEGLGVLDVVAPLHPHPGGEQPRIDLGGGPPHPPGHLRPPPHGRSRIRLPPHRPGRQPVGTEGGDLHTTVLGRSESPAVGHGCECDTGV
ncbi:hypothetical protein M2157_004360 [Streptomyces sp. SAI-127]|nr:hypothetical protein [Streptomyces sp. SAI-127]